MGCVDNCMFSLSPCVCSESALRAHPAGHLGILLICWYSIREFVELDTPIFMFDKDGAFVVMRLEQVCRTPPVDIGRYIDGMHSYYRYHSAQKLYPLQPLYQHKTYSYGKENRFEKWVERRHIN